LFLSFIVAPLLGVAKALARSNQSKFFNQPAASFSFFLSSLSYAELSIWDVLQEVVIMSGGLAVLNTLNRSVNLGLKKNLREFFG
jgi:hypothetical protein